MLKELAMLIFGDTIADMSDKHIRSEMARREELRAKIASGKKSPDPEKARYWRIRELNMIHGTPSKRQIQFASARPRRGVSL